ncbi:hypothetical protein KIPE111705_20540 [Kibdelosporangium persicum]|uniref:hypothetical protein n=1 Tax=Kibdelosporangium persicum TaxID=2698649 RepID=UPI0015649900|nr:hypothetical protein [Kibdelosporangium persicum]
MDKKTRIAFLTVGAVATMVVVVMAAIERTPFLIIMAVLLAVLFVTSLVTIRRHARKQSQ